ncbi:hypothetical protein V1509DRAFT_615104 [Lipomyces kononenkoae]
MRRAHMIIPTLQGAASALVRFFRSGLLNTSALYIIYRQDVLPPNRSILLLSQKIHSLPPLFHSLFNIRVCIEMTWALVHRSDDSYYSRYNLYEGYNARFNPQPRSFTATSSHVPAFSYRMSRADRDALRRKSQDQEVQPPLSEELRQRLEHEQYKSQSAIADDEAESSTADKNGSKTRRRSSASSDVILQSHVVHMMSQRSPRA